MSNIKIYTRVNETTMFFGEGHGIQEFVDLKYPEFLKLQEQQNEQLWAHDEFKLKLDAAQLNSCNQAIRHIFTSNLQSQIFADTIQGRGPAWLLPYVSDPSLEAFIIEWAKFEVLHSRAYSYMLTSMYPNPRLVLDMIEQKPEVFQRFSSCMRAYNNFFADPNPENLVILIAAINILEGLAFFASFACNFGFANMGLFESVSKYLVLTARDESLHLAGSQRIIKNWREGKDGKFWKDLWNKLKDQVREMYVEAIQEEYVWSAYLFKYGTPIVGLNESSLNTYIEFMANKRMKNIGLKVYNNVNKDPLPWIQSKFLTNKAYQSAPQEVSIAQYLKNQVIPMDNLSDLRKLFD